jgi:hypothetical protein
MAAPKSKYRDTMLTKYEKSIPVTPELYEDKDFPCIFRPRINKEAHIADQGSLDLRRDLVDTGDDTNWVGCMSSSCGNLIALWGAESFPERLHIIAYVSEYAFWHDGKDEPERI